METKYIRLKIHTAFLTFMVAGFAATTRVQASLPVAEFDFSFEGATSNSFSLNHTEPNGGETASGILGADPYVSAGATGSGTYPNLSASENGSYLYFFEVLSTNNGTVPIVISANGEATRSSVDDSAGASLALNGADISGMDLNLVVNSGPLQQSFSTLSYDVNVAPNTQYDVDLSVSATVYGTGNASAWVDPQISINPVYVADNPGVASLEFSPNFLSAPEPSIAGLLTLGIGLAGWLIFRRKHKKQIV